MLEDANKSSKVPFNTILFTKADNIADSVYGCIERKVCCTDLRRIQSNKDSEMFRNLYKKNHLTDQQGDNGV